MSPHPPHEVPPLDAAGEPFPMQRRELLLVAAFWTLFALVTIANRLLDPRRPAPSGALMTATVALAFLQSLLWALCTPLLFRVAGRLGSERRRALHVLAALAAGLLAAVLVSSIVDAVRDLAFPSPRRGFGPPRSRGFLNIGGFQFFNDLVIALGVLVAGLARAYSLRLRARQAQAALLHAQLAEARLDALRRQLDPHFLFNTLHAVSSLVERDPRGVRRMISRLSDLLRHNMEGDDAPEVPLRQELDLLGRYLDIMQVRFQGRLDVAMQVDDAVLDALVPNLILQPLVENAIRHGVEKLTGEGRIVLTARRDGGALVLRVTDNGPGPSDGAPGTRSGVGLRNTIARLEQLYGSAQRFSLQPGPDGGAVAEVRLPIRTRSDLHVGAPVTRIRERADAR